MICIAPSSSRVLFGGLGSEDDEEGEADTAFVRM